MRNVFLVILAGVLFTTSVHSSLAEILAARTLRVGSIIAKADIRLTDDRSTAVVEQIVGKEIKRSVYVGRQIKPDDVGPVTIVDRNDVVRLYFQHNGLGIRTEARALEPGGLGEEINVMNLETRVTVRALVIGNKRVRVSR